MNLFRLDASIRTEGSVSRALADTAERSWSAAHPSGTVVRRDLGLRPLPAESLLTAVAARWVLPEEHTEAQRDALALATTIGDEITAADAYLLAIPLYNFGVPHHVKAWIDLALTDPRLSSGVETPLAGRPAALVIARGGGYGPGTPREGWDHSTPYLLRIFRDVWGMDVHLTEAELTLAPVVPAMEPLRGLAERSLSDAHDTADRHGRVLADAVLAKAA
jgi:FMN-dependent NADH-azoreductase